ncbi:MAG: TadE family type IV pilus minor pilin [Marmoricola sp.]
MSARRQRSEDGAVTAEAAIGIGMLVIVAMGLAWMVCLGVVAVRAQDAAREAVRALVRGDERASAVGLAEQVATTGSTVSTQTDGRLTRVTVRSPVVGPGGIFGFIGPFVVTGVAVGVVEGSGG